LLTPSALLQDLTRRSKEVVTENIARFVAEGDRMARIENKANTIPQIALDMYDDEPLTVAVVPIDRPNIRYYPDSSQVDLRV
jgi:hypothetical protein